MYPLPVKFSRFEDVSFGDVLKETGVYVIWDSQARAKPSYIGMGDILTRLSSHDDRFAFPVRGYIALLGSSGRKSENDEAAILEALLLRVAEKTERWPTHNKKHGNMSLVRRAYKSSGVVRVTVSGYDPFGPPKAPRFLAESKQIWFELNSGGEDEVTHHWNLRKLLKR